MQLAEEPRLAGGVMRGQECGYEKETHTSIPALQPFSNTAIAAKLPEPIVTYGSLSVEPCGCIVNRWGPVASTPPRTRAAPM